MGGAVDKICRAGAKNEAASGENRRNTKRRCPVPGGKKLREAALDPGRPPASEASGGKGLGESKTV